MGTTLKHRLFSTEPMGEKSVSELPGVGSQTAKHLTRLGCVKASGVFGVYLMLERDQQRFVNWMKTSGKTTDHRAMQTYVCLEEYSQNFVFGNSRSNGNERPSTSNLHTTKHRAFITEPMGDKKVTDLPGVGAAAATRLRAAGIDKAEQILQTFLRLRKDKKKFEEWMKQSCKATTARAMQCYECLVSYCQHHRI